MGKRLYTAIAFICVSIMSAGFAWGAGIADTYGLGVRAVSLGGAFTAVADDYSATFYNPAGLSQLTGHRFAIEYLYTTPDIDIKTLAGTDLRTYDGRTPPVVRNDPANGLGGDDLNLGLPLIGAVLDLNRMARLPLNAQLGIAICLPENADIAYRINDYPPDQPHLFRFGDDVDRIVIAQGLGLELVPGLVHVGAGVQAMLYGPGTFYVDQMMLNDEHAVVQGEFGAILRWDPTAGILMTPFDGRLKLGLSWKDEQQLRLEPIPNIAKISIGGIETVVTMVMDINAYFTPEEISAGLALDVDPVLVSVQVDKQYWSAYDYSYSDRAHYQPSKIVDPLNGIETGSPDFDDTLNYRMGLEYRIGDKARLMAGYAFIPTPIPNQSGRISNFIDTDRRVYSLGASYVLDRDIVGIVKPPVTFACVLQYQDLDSYIANKEGVVSPSWGTQQSYTVEGSVLAAGISVSLAW